MTTQEASKLLEISKDYLSESQLKEFLQRLETEFSTNSDYQQYLTALKTLLEPPKPLPKWLKPTLYVLIVVHFILVCGVGLSFVLLPFLAPPYISLPLMVFIWSFSTARDLRCVMTDAENWLRGQLGMRQINGFVGHYFKKPVMILLGKIRR